MGKRISELFDLIVMKHIIAIILFLATISCKKDIYSEISFEVPVFTDSVYANTEVLNDTLYTKFVMDCASYKEYVILFANIDNYLFHFLDKNTGAIVKSFGQIGRGPQEILQISQFHVNETHGLLTAYQQMTKEIYVFHLDSVLQNKGRFIDKIDLRKYENMTFLNIYKCNDGFLLHGGKCTSFPGGARFSRFSDKGELMEVYDQYPINSRRASDSTAKRMDWEDLYLTRTISPDGSKLAEGTRLGGILEIFDMSNKITSRHLKGYYKPYFYKQGNEDIYTEKTQWCFYQLTASDHYLYALSFNGGHNGYPVCEMQVFDWQGNPVKKYKTDRPLMNICVDENRRKVYAVSLTPMREALLISFNL